MPVPHSTILQLINTDDSSFIAATVARKGCMNSALFCEELVVWMINHFGDRITVAEKLPVACVNLYANNAVLDTAGPTVTASKVVLCTNGFENFEIKNHAGPDIEKEFHDTVKGRIGYMAGYLDGKVTKATAISYYRKNTLQPYDYLTRRPYECNGEEQSLICIGGPERHLPDRANYDAMTSFPADIEEDLDRGLRMTYREFPHTATRTFLWQGLMGYTSNGLRRIGFEPKNRVLLYNLGCNGVGILPSIYGGKRIGQLLAGADLPPSIFDPEFGHL